VFCVVAKGSLTGPSQQSSLPSVYDILDLGLSFSAVKVIEVEISHKNWYHLKS